MKERGIIFSSRMVLALLAGSKTQTRRIVKPQPTRVDEHMMRLTDGRQSASVTVPAGWQWRETYGADNGGHFDKALAEHCPHGRAGDRLWVRETFAAERVGKGRGKNAEARVFYRASCENDECDLFDEEDECIKRVKIHRWTSPIFMPRFVSRITLEITEVRAERLHDISELDAAAEGVGAMFEMDPADFVRGKSISGSTFAIGFKHAWKDINGADSWDANPFVWALTFRRVEEPCR